MLESIGEILTKSQWSNGNGTTTTDHAPSRPDSETCEFCGIELPYRPMEHPLIEGRIMGWFKPLRCDCERSRLHWEKVDEAEAKRIAEELRQAEEQERIKNVDKLFRMSHLPPRFKSRTFENYAKTQQNILAFETARRYAERFEELRKEGTGLSFTGTVGTGKTHLAAAVTLELIQKGYSVIFGTVTNLLGQIKATFDDDSKINERQLIDQLINVSLLVIDDLGKEKPTPWVEQTLYEIINARYENNKPVIVTSNMSLSDLKNNYVRNGDAIESRLVEMCHGLECNWNDHRKKELF